MYKIVAKCIEGLNITGFSIQDESKEKLVSYEDAIMLAKKAKISNAEVVNNPLTNEVDIVVTDSVGVILRNGINEVQVKTRVIDGVTKRCIGFIVENEDKGQFRVSPDKLWTMASENGVHGLKGIIKGGKRLVLSLETGYLESIQRMEV